jgi:hypothetical protein
MVGMDDDGCGHGGRASSGLKRALRGGLTEAGLKLEHDVEGPPTMEVVDPWRRGGSSVRPPRRH